jgi:hypothetical protein
LQHVDLPTIRFLTMLSISSAFVDMCISGELALAGLFHVLPGPTLKMQSDKMGLPQWFIFCAGLLMLATALFRMVHPGIGIVLTCICMGGAGATARKMPTLIEKLPGMLISTFTFLAAVWAKLEVYPWKILLPICVVFYLVGVAGRIHGPTNSTLIQLFAKLRAKLFAKKQDDVKTAKIKEGLEMPKKMDDIKLQKVPSNTEKVGASKRAASPGVVQASPDSE